MKTANARGPKSRLLTFIVIALILLAGYLQFMFDRHYDYFKKQQTFVTLPSGKTLRIVSFGFKNLVADMLFIWSIQFYSNYRLTNSYDYLERVFNTITDLTPRYKDPYLVGSWIMALEAHRVDMAMRLLEKGAKNMPDEWIFDSECGFYAYNMKDYKQAEIYFNRAAAHPSAPSYLRREKAHMVYMENNLPAAYAMWLEIYRTAKERIERDSAVNHLQQIKFEMDKRFLESRIAIFKQIYKRLPRSLEELKRVRLIDAVPQDFDGNDYLYDPGTGEVTAQKVFRWKKSF
ncbi:MAG: tetratricopeptide repeat protein [Candidatus Omnitrophota bacterium]